MPCVGMHYRTYRKQFCYIFFLLKAFAHLVEEKLAQKHGNIMRAFLFLVSSSCNG